MGTRNRRNSKLFHHMTCQEETILQSLFCLASLEEKRRVFSTQHRGPGNGLWELPATFEVFGLNYPAERNSSHENRIIHNVSALMSGGTFYNYDALLSRVESSQSNSCGNIVSKQIHQDLIRRITLRHSLPTVPKLTFLVWILPAR